MDALERLAPILAACDGLGWSYGTPDDSEPLLDLMEAVRAILQVPVEPVGEWSYDMEAAPKEEYGFVMLLRPTAPKWMKVAPGNWNDQRCASKPRPYWSCPYRIADMKDCRDHPPTAWMRLPTPVSEREVEG